MANFLSRLKAHKVQIILVVIIPVVTIGFNLLESTHPYQRLIGVDNVDSIVNQELLGLNLTGGTQNHEMFQSNPDFEEIWHLIKNNTNIPFPRNQQPRFIGLMSPHAHDYADIWNGASTARVLLIPNSVPVLVGFCAPGGIPPCQQNQNAFIIGTAQDIENWAQAQKDHYETLIDSVIAAFSIVTGILMTIF